MPKRDQAAASCKLTFLPSAAAALASVVRVKLASFSSSNLFKAARLVCMRLASSAQEDGVPLAESELPEPNDF
jgi:hypothetical protein